MKYTQLWEVMRDHFDFALLPFYEFMAYSVEVPNFVSCFSSVLELWTKPEDLRSIAEALELKTAPEPTRLRRVLASSATCALLFRELGLQVGYTEYLILIKEKLNDLEHMDFSLGESESFRKVLSAETKSLMEGGHKSFDRKVAQVEFLSVQIHLPVTTLNDDWQFRLAARIKDIALNTGAVLFLPWESLFYDIRGIPNTREVCLMPPELLKDYANVRKTLLKLLGSVPLTFREMRRVVTLHVQPLLALERTFVLEQQFLFEHAETLAIARVQADVLKQLPDGGSGESLSFPQVKAKLCTSYKRVS